MKTLMSLAAVALLAMGCSAPPPISMTDQQGPSVIGSAGLQGPVGIVDPWTAFTELWFDFNEVNLQSSEMTKVSEIAEYMDQNPSLQLGIDGSMEPGGTGPRNQNLSNRRVDVIRSALIEAGVPDYKIRTGAFGDAGLARERRIEMFLRNAYFIRI
jgi:outer membrane protein OmpA-like peptidoglycan-associated protein